MYEVLARVRKLVARALAVHGSVNDAADATTARRPSMPDRAIILILITRETHESEGEGHSRERKKLYRETHDAHACARAPCDVMLGSSFPRTAHHGAAGLGQLGYTNSATGTARAKHD